MQLLDQLCFHWFGLLTAPNFGASYTNVEAVVFSIHIKL